MSDRFFGYCILSILTIIILLPAGFVFKHSLNHVESCIVDFGKINSISFLNEQDPVRVRGVQVGVVRRITSSKENTLVEISISKPFILYNDYSITAYLKGFMGDRYVSIYQGNFNSNQIDKDIILKGNFLNGPTEIIANVGKLKTVLHSFNQIAITFKDGTPEKASFVNQFANFAQKTDTLTNTIYAISKNIDIAINRNKDTIQYFVNQTKQLTDSLSGNIPALISDLHKTISSTEKLIQQIDIYLTKADKFISEIKNPEAILWKNDIKDIQINLQSLDELLIDLKVNGLQFNVRLRK